MKKVVLLLFLFISSCNQQPIPAQTLDIRLSEHFTQSEFTCKCGCGETKVNMQLIIKLEELRERLKVPIIITSGYRCEKHNREVGGVKHSQHLYGNAVDIKVKGYTPEQVAKIVKEVGFSFVRIYKSWVHVDVR
jgi:uncharacterized protein YcbK (DUF882 family)